MATKLRACLAAPLLVCASVAAQTTNLLPNPSFEAGDAAPVAAVADEVDEELVFGAEFARGGLEGGLNRGEVEGLGGRGGGWG